MCDPVTATVLAVTTAAVGQIGAYKSGKAQAAALAYQSQVQADEISRAAGNELTERARAARRERAAARAAGSEAGINLGSGSFIAALQNSAMNQINDQGLIIQNERNQQRARVAQTRSLASQIQVPSGLSAALAIGSAGVGAWNDATKTQKRGTAKAVAKAANP